jgi:cytochrome o ubiquinol oxidase subunit 2
MIRRYLSHKLLSKHPSRVSGILGALLIFGLTTLLSGCETFTGVLNPKGVIASDEYKLLVDSVALMLIVVIPVIIMSFAFIYYYRASKKADYRPNWSHSYLLETIWWSVPIVIIVILGVLSWKYTHKLDPYRKIDDSEVALNVEVVTLPWRFLFIYPEQNIATINELTIPVGKQVKFTLTADNSAMAAFFIPQIGSQIYTMAGMKTQLHLLANEVGTYRGLNSQYNGDGFSDMHFPVYVVDDKGMDDFYKKAKASGNELTHKDYVTLREPTENTKAIYFAGVDKNLFQSIIDSYMGHDMHKGMNHAMMHESNQ